VWVGLFALGASVGAQELWRIGEFDNSYDEFACARNHNAFAGAFRQDPVFRVGTSNPKTDWSFVNPGPSDHWAGARAHPFTIEFDLPEAPKVALRLKVDLVDVQGFAPTSMGVRVNDVEGVFRLRNGNEASIHDPAAGKEQVISLLLAPSLMRAGANRIVLWSTGSWFLYDAISLSVEGGADMTPKVRSLTLEPTVFFKRLPGGGLAQVVIARVEVEGAPEGLTITARAGGGMTVTPVKAALSFGTVEQEMLIPEVTSETPVEVEAELGDSVARAETVLKPARKWRIYVAPSVHTDIGYTDLQPRVARLHNDNTDRAIEYCAKYPAFGWALETAWQADIYRHDRSREQCEKLYELTRQGRVEVEASYLNMLTGLCSHEELNRWLYYAQALKRRYGVPLQSALTSDVPTQAWSLPSTLAAAGIRYYATGINTTRGYTFNKLMTGHPYWWEGPDGSRVLAYFSPGYAHAAGPFSSLDDLRSWVIANTRNRADFPYDALYLYGGFGDNQPIQENVAATAQQWADTYEYPKVVVGPNAEYFRYMEETYGDQLPTVRGDGGYYWEDGAASSAYETGINRRAHETASAADALFAFAHCAGGARPPKSKLGGLWRNILLYDEHTWGAYCSISDPDNPFSTEQWRIKAAFAQDADRQSRELLDASLAGLAKLIRTDGPALVVFNTTGWDRENALVEVDLPSGAAPGNPATGKPLLLAQSLLREGAYRAHLVVPAIPAWGYVACPLVEGPAVQAVLGEAGETPALENRHFRLTVDAQRGGITSLVDKATGRELVDQNAPYSLGEYLYVSGGDGTNLVDIGAGKAAELTVHEPEAREAWKHTRIPGICDSLTFTGQTSGTPSVSITVTLHDATPRIDFHVQIRRSPERKKEAAYFAFPFAATNPEVRLEIPNGVMRPEVDQLPGACKEWYALQHFARIRSDEGEIAWASVDAPLLCVGDINRGLWPEKLDAKNGHLYSYVMNNYWFTNYKADQGGEMTFRYALTPRFAGDAEAARFGWQTSMPVHTAVIAGAQAGPLPSTPTSLCRVSPESVAITALKTPEVGSGLVIRLFSYADRPLTATVRIGLPALRRAELCNLVEEPIGELALRGSEVRVPVRPMAPTTLILR
jgi:hypothetical protein